MKIYLNKKKIIYLLFDLNDEKKKEKFSSRNLNLDTGKIICVYSYKIIKINSNLKFYIIFFLFKY